MADILTTQIDPVEGLVNYTKFVKPFHSKILEVLVEYIHTDCIDVTFTEDFRLSLGAPDALSLSKWGWTEEQAQKHFNCNSQVYQVSDVNPGGGYWDIVGNFESLIDVGDVVLYQDSELGFTEYTVVSATAMASALDIDGSGTTINFDFTRIVVSETIPITSPTKGVIHPYKSTFTDSNGVNTATACWTYDSKTTTYVRNTGIVWPSLPLVEQNIDCGGFGSIFQQAVSGSPPTLPDGLGASNTINGVSNIQNYFDIPNRVGVPSVIGTWQDAFTYGVKFTVTGSTANDGDDYTVFTTTIVAGSPELLRVYTTGNVPSSIVDGTIQLRPWGYSEPTVCVDHGQALAADANIAENMLITINDIGTNIVQGWDTVHWDMSGYDSGPFTYLVAFT